MAGYPYRLVIDNTAETTALVDADTVFAEIGVSAPTDAQTAQMETVIEQVSGLFDEYTDRVLAEEDVTEHFRQPASEALRLSRFPVTEILQVIENGTELTPDDYEIEDATGQLWRLYGDERQNWSDTGAIQVSYIGGYALPDDLPTAIQRAAVDQAKALYMGGGRDPMIRSFQVSDVYQETVSVAGGSTMGESALLPQVRAALAPYRRTSI